MKNKEEKQRVKCPKCSHKFKTGSKLGLISCSNCGCKFKREENLIKLKEVENQDVRN